MKQLPEDDIEWSDEQLIEAGIDKSALCKLIADLQSAARRLQKLNMSVYVNSSGASIHLDGMEPHDGYQRAQQENMIATVSGKFDGGDW